ncbi:hypothetical protein VTN00DRAFT_3553 [Thermoascus crustaceus]|uniref:uncharacterized protein n=1 Tax=Thermoascus crustaceus TaxID=5088 RepID=UPI0037425138
MHLSAVSRKSSHLRGNIRANRTPTAQNCVDQAWRMFYLTNTGSYVLYTLFQMQTLCSYEVNKLKDNDWENLQGDSKQADGEAELYNCDLRENWGTS